MHFRHLAQTGLAVIPKVNLLSNIGFGDGATYTKSKNSIMSNFSTDEMIFPLLHPLYIARDTYANQITLKRAGVPTPSQNRGDLYKRLRQKLSALLPKLVR